MSDAMRLGTRGSDLALWQARHVAALLRDLAGVEAREVVITTTGDESPDLPMVAGIWPSGGFTGELEAALAREEIDAAVHSCKDLPTESPDGLVIAATPTRGPVHDVLVCHSDVIAERIRAALAGDGSGPALRIGTSSPRRIAQMHHHFGAEHVPIRGNVPTRVGKASGDDLDAVCLAGAGIHRLGLEPEHVVELPTDRFPTAPGQGAVAVQARRGTEAERTLLAISDAATARCVAAERAVLREMSAGCHTALAAAALLTDDGTVELRVQAFSDDWRLFESAGAGADGEAVGRELARETRAWLDGP